MGSKADAAEIMMKVLLEGPERVKLVPETKHERDALNALWQVVIRCDEDSKVLCPIGSYNPQADDGASFVIQDQ